MLFCAARKHTVGVAKQVAGAHLLRCSSRHLRTQRQAARHSHNKGLAAAMVVSGHGQITTEMKPHLQNKENVLFGQRIDENRAHAALGVGKGGIRGIGHVAQDPEREREETIRHAGRFSRIKISIRHDKPEALGDCGAGHLRHGALGQLRRRRRSKPHASIHGSSECEMRMTETTICIFQQNTPTHPLTCPAERQA